jgi:glutamyl-tRNA synthetase
MDFNKTRLKDKNIVRFAPSPTNCHENPNKRNLHIGGCRTALFNYIVSKQQSNSHCIMRCEDTDTQRSNDECLRCMIQDLKWIGIEFDAGFKLENNQLTEFNNTNVNFGPLRQSKRQYIHQQYTRKLLELGKAYEKDGAIFFRSSKEDIIFKDEILGEIKFTGDQIEDFVLQKSSGIASFYAACTYDDHDMQVSLVIRGQEHLNTSPRQIALQRALGLKTPKYSHVPLLMDSFGKKLSKRDATQQVNVADFKEKGFLSNVLVNYLLSLGYNFPTEEFDIKFAIENFDLNKINTSNARFDYKKLLRFNQNALARMSKDEFKYRLIEYGQEYFPSKVASLKDKFNVFIDLYYGRIKTLEEAFTGCEWLYDDTISKQTLIKIDNNSSNILDFCYKHLERCQEWNSDSIMDSLKEVSKVIGTSLGKIVQPVRLSITGQEISPPIDQVMLTLGKNVTLYRIKNNGMQIITREAA